MVITGIETGTTSVVISLTISVMTGIGITTQTVVEFSPEIVHHRATIEKDPRTNLTGTSLDTIEMVTLIEQPSKEGDHARVTARRITKEPWQATLAVME